MLTKPLDDLQAHYSDLKQLCLSSDEPIFLKDKWRNRLVLMNCEFYEKLTAEYDMTRYGLWLDTGEMRKRNETPLPYAEITDEPIFVSDGDGRDIIFMTPALYHHLLKIFPYICRLPVSYRCTARITVSPTIKSASSC